MSITTHTTKVTNTLQSEKMQMMKRLGTLSKREEVVVVGRRYRNTCRWLRPPLEGIEGFDLTRLNFIVGGDGN